MDKRHSAGYAILAFLLGFTGIAAFNGVLLAEGTPPRSADEFVEEVKIDSTTNAVRPSPIEEALLHPRRLRPLPPNLIDQETLWLARCIYAETKRPEEQELVAWIIRNRVETGYRGKHAYESVILDPYQFSTFNPDNERRPYYANLGIQSKAPGWQRAVFIAYHVRHADSLRRPFSSTTRHFFSERSMVESTRPYWIEGQRPVKPDRHYRIDALRFRFYDGVS